MAEYALYSYEIQEGDKSLLYEETGNKCIDKANEIVFNLLKGKMTIIGKKKNQDRTLKSLKHTEHDGVFTMVLCNTKDITQYEGHDKFPLESHPGSFIIIDNRPDVCQIAIERNSAFDSNTDKVIKYIKRSFKEYLSDYGLKIIIKRKFEAKVFKERVMERLMNHNDHVKQIVWEFPNPDKVKGIDATAQMKKRLESLKLMTQATNALKGKLTLTGSKNNPLCVDDEKIDDLSLMIALCAQNNYNLSYSFFHTPMIKFKDVAYAFCNIDNCVIRDFELGQLVCSEGGQTYELIEVLDNVRKQIEDYDNEKTIDD